MRTKQLFLAVLAIGLSRCLIHADGLAGNSTNPAVKKLGGYSVLYDTNRNFTFVNPSEFWDGTWKEDTNGWRVQLRVYSETNLTLFRDGLVDPLSTNLILRVEWGSAVKNSGDGYLLSPNGKFAKFELLDAHGKVVPPNPNAGTNLLERTLENYPAKLNLTYEPHRPAWASPSSGSLEANFPPLTTTNVYPRFPYGGIAGEIGSVTNRPPFFISFLKLDNVYQITNEGDYTLTVQPVLYKRYNHTNTAILDRVDLPAVSMTIHLVPNAK